MQYSLLPPLSATKWNPCLLSIRNRVFYVSPQSPSNNVDVMENPYANFTSFQTGKRTVKFALFFIHSRFRIEPSSAYLIDCYITKHIQFNIITLFISRSGRIYRNSGKIILDWEKIENLASLYSWKEEINFCFFITVWRLHKIHNNFAISTVISHDSWWNKN